MKKEVREGYKITELGEIPNEWDIIALGEIGEFKNGINKSKEDFGFGCKFVNIQDAYSGNIVKNDLLERINVNDKEKEIYKLENDDIILVRSSVKPEGVGYPILFKKENEDIVYCGFMIRYRYNKRKINPMFLLYQLRSENIRKRVLDLSTVSANTNINQDSYKQIKISIPSVKEQEKIAEILSTVDEQIENTEKLIQKNQELKKGLMQQLLTKGIGHTEFKKTEIGDIPKEWEVKIFKDISKVSQGLQIAIEERFKEFKQGRLPYITIQYINDKSNSDNEYFIENYNENVVCYESDILMTRTGNTGIVITNEYGVFHNNFFKVDFDRTKLNKDFLVYYLNTPFIQNLIIRYAGTTTIPDLKHSDFYKLPVLVPKIEEQKKIALILSSIDENIIEYKDKKEKLKILKRGLMQKLLSGEIRILNFNEN
ncbi:restriction endonuclease subunit S [Clostridium perfringens]|uniref:restriction endonuclease subunit S n=1 Tax=Clostridium perfringens TaxID=1502 RepID=UPI0039E94383